MKAEARWVKGGGYRWRLIVHPESHVGKCIRRGQGRAYEADMLDHIRRHHDAGELALDIGAHIGNHTLYMAIACNLHVIAFEPIFYRELTANIELNQLEQRVYVVPCGLGERSEYMQDSGERVLSNPLGPIDESEGKLLHDDGKIAVHPLDSFEWSGIPFMTAPHVPGTVKRISLIKADIEGMEPEMLKGAVTTLKRHKPVLYLETKTEDDVTAVGEILEPLGYEIVARFKNLTQRTAWAVPA